MLRPALMAAVAASMIAVGPALAQVAPTVGPSRELIREYLYGFQLMSAAERARYREHMRRVDSEAACAVLTRQWQAELERRAAERGKTLVPERGEFCKRRDAGALNGDR